MRHHRLSVALAFSGICVLLALARPSSALPLQTGSILVIDSGVLSEYSPSGDVLQAFLIPFPGQVIRSERACDLIVRADGSVAIYNGNFDPRLTLWLPGTDTFQHYDFPGWSTVNNLAYGGIAAWGRFVYATDMFTFGDNGADQAMGIVRFDGATGSFERFADQIEFTDVSVGLDGLLYALSADGVLRVFDPSSMASLRTLTLSSLTRSIAVDADGSIYAGAFDGIVTKLSAAGAVVTSLVVAPPNEIVTDIDVDATGRIVLTTRGSGVKMTDTSLSAAQARPIRAGFVAFSTPVPEASTAGLAGAGLLFASLFRKGRSGR